MKASWNFMPLSTYRIVCPSMGTSGGVALGKYHSIDTPVCYDRTGGSEDDYWYIHEEKNGLYSIQNAATKQYITYDGVRSGSNRRYMTVTDEMIGDSSLWSIQPNDAGTAYIIVCAKAGIDQPAFNVRSNNVVGTFTVAQSDNAVFVFYDSQDQLFKLEKLVNHEHYGTTLDGYYWENMGLKQPVAYTTDKKNPVWYYIKNVRSGKFVSVDPNDNCLYQTDEEETAFYFMEGRDGVNIYVQGGRYVNGYIGARGQKNVRTIAGATTTSNNTWELTFSDNYQAYGVGVVTCSDNGDNNSFIWRNERFWNDLYNDGICYYSLDGGSVFMFYSKDERHRQLLASNGLYVPGASDVVTDYTLKELLDTLLVGGKSAVYDKRNQLYMMPISEFYRDKKDFNATLTYHSSLLGNVQLRIDDNPVGNGEKYNFGVIEAGKNYAFSLYQGNKKMASSNLTFTYLPVVEISGSSFNTSTYRAGKIRVNDPNSPDAIDSLYIAYYRYRGATASGKQKKAYAIKLRDANGEPINRSFLGMRSDNNWILDAMAIDPGRMRNRVATDLWLDFSVKPYQSQYEKKAVNGTRGKFVEVLLNGNYVGLYCLTEKVDRKQLKLKKWDKGIRSGVPDTIRGVLFKSSAWTYEIFMGHEPDQRNYPMYAPSNYSNTSETWKSWEYKYPDLDDGETIDWNPLYQPVNCVAAESKDLFQNHVSNYFDLPVFKDYYLFIDLMLATDNHGKNMYLYSYDQTRFEMLSVCPWDLDGVFGRRWDGSMNLTRNATQDFITFLWAYEHGEYTIYKRLRNYDYMSWSQGLADRYAELRKTYFRHSSLLKRFVDYRELFRDSGADQREINRWQGTDGIYMDFDNEISFLDNWLKTRLETLDKAYGVPDGIRGQVKNDYFGVTGGEGCLYIHSTVPQTLNVYSLTGMKVKEVNAVQGVMRVDGLQAGVYIVKDKKVMIR